MYSGTELSIADYVTNKITREVAGTKNTKIAWVCSVHIEDETVLAQNQFVQKWKTEDIKI